MSYQTVTSRILYGLEVFSLELGLAAARGDLGVFVGSVEVEELGFAVVPVADYSYSC